MTTPKRDAILQKARALYVEDCYKRGCPELADVNPEDSELAESGFVAVAKTELMTNTETKNEQWLNAETSEFEFDAKEGMATTTFIGGSRGTGKSDIAMMICDKLENEGVICIVFDSSTDWIKRSGVRQYLKADPLLDLPIPEGSVIVDMSTLTPLVQQGCVERFCKQLFEFQLYSTKRFYLVLEEAQLFFPLNSLRSLKTQNTMRILTVGRNFNVSVCAISQFPAVIDAELRKHAGQLFIGYSAEPNTIKYWRGMIGEHAEKLKELQNGQFVYFNRNKISLTEIESYDSAVPKRQITIAVPQPAPTPNEPMRQQEQISLTAVLRLGMLIFFAALFLYVISRA